MFDETKVLIHSGNIANYSNNDTALLMNVALGRFINVVTATASVPNNYGTSTITLNFTGNASTYWYSVHMYGTAIFDTSGSCGSSGSFSHTFATGTYQLKVDAHTAGTGQGSTFSTPESILTFIVQATDAIASPYVSLIGSCSVSGSTVSVNGVPFWTSGSGAQFPHGSLMFYNVKNSFDPTVLGRCLYVGVDSG